MTWKEASVAQRKEVIKELLEDRLAEKNYTLAQLGKRMVWSRGHVSNIIKGHRELDFLDWVDLCKSLDIELSAFIADFENKLRD